MEQVFVLIYYSLSCLRSERSWRRTSSWRGEAEELFIFILGEAFRAGASRQVSATLWANAKISSPTSLTVEDFVFNLQSYVEHLAKPLEEKGFCVFDNCLSRLVDGTPPCMSLDGLTYSSHLGCSLV